MTEPTRSIILNPFQAREVEDCFVRLTDLASLEEALDAIDPEGDVLGVCTLGVGQGHTDISVANMLRYIQAEREETTQRLADLGIVLGPIT